MWHRFTHVDNNQLSYISEDESYDAICLTPRKDIKFAGFSIYAVTTNDQTFTCLYKIKIGNESLPEKQADFTKNDVDDKICDIMFKQNVLVRKNEPIIIAVRMVAGDEFFCSTYLGYGGETH